MKLGAQFKATAEMIKVSHSVFALPFALAAAALAMVKYASGLRDRMSRPVNPSGCLNCDGT